MNIHCLLTATWPYLGERAWGTVREDYSANGDAWNFFPHDHARSRAYRWGEDGMGGICDEQQRLCLALWNGRDPILKERAFGLTPGEGNHGEDVKEYFFYLDATLHLLPTLWFRNTWSWGDPEQTKPQLRAIEPGRAAWAVTAVHPTLGEYYLYGKQPARGLFTENETNFQRLFVGPNASAYVKDAFHRRIIQEEIDAVNPAQVGTKFAAWQVVECGPGESRSDLFGGNSNWRGPVWLSINYFLLRALSRFHEYLGPDFKVPLPVAQDGEVNLEQVVDLLVERLLNLFRRNAQGIIPAHPPESPFQHDSHWQNLCLFYEYYHGEPGQGLGAMHQTGWSGLVANLIKRKYPARPATRWR